MRDLVNAITPLVLALCWLAPSVRGQADGNFWWLRDTTEDSLESTPLPESDQPPCECVKYYLCINGTISTSGAGILDVRLGGNRDPPPPPPPRNRNAVQCPDLYDVCCAPPPPPTTTPTTTQFPTLPPDTPCDCVAFTSCTGERIVTDGKGNTSLEAFGLYLSHSACPHAFTVCCALEPTPTVPAVNASYNPTHPHCDCVDPYMCDATGTIVTSGADMLDLRTMYPNPNPNITCENHRHICCNLPPGEVTFTSDRPTTQSPNPTTEDLVEEPPQSCGTRNSMGIAVSLLGLVLAAYFAHAS